MRDLNPIQSGLSGSLLIAHPGLLDPNFVKTVVLISAYSSDDGALGIVLNRPLERTLGEIGSQYKNSSLAKTPLFYGGPCNQEELILTAWKWDSAHLDHAENDFEVDGGGPESPDEHPAAFFRLYFGISEEKAAQLLEQDPDIDLRGFMGYAGWSGGQIEMELAQSAWVISAVDAELLKRYPPVPSAADQTIKEGVVDLSGYAAPSGKKLWRDVLVKVRPELSILTDAPEDPSGN